MIKCCCEYVWQSISLWKGLFGISDFITQDELNSIGCGILTMVGTNKQAFCTFTEIFQKKNINLGDKFFLVKAHFSGLNFWTTLLSKIMPNFWWTGIPRKNFLNVFH